MFTTRTPAVHSTLLTSCRKAHLFNKSGFIYMYMYMYAQVVDGTASYVILNNIARFAFCVLKSGLLGTVRGL